LLQLNAPRRTHNDYVKYVENHPFCEHEKKKLFPQYSTCNRSHHGGNGEGASSIPSFLSSSLGEMDGVFIVNESENVRKLTNSMKILDVDSRRPKGKDRGFHLHPTCLVKIPHFDIVLGSPYDYMHLICESVVDYLL